MDLRQWLLKKRMENKKFTVTHFAEKLGIATPHLSAISNYLMQPRYDLLLRIIEMTEREVDLEEYMRESCQFKKDKHGMDKKTC